MHKMITDRPEMADAVTPENVVQESYFNLCQLQDLTSYADPIGAIRALGLRLRVRRDACGNILTLQP